MRRLAPALAVLVLVATATVQVWRALEPPFGPPWRPPGAAEARWVATAGCSDLQDRYRTHHAAWRAGVKAGREPAENLAAMRLILHRLGRLERAGRCGG